MEPDTAQEVVHLISAAPDEPDTSATKRLLVEFLSGNTGPLLGTLRSYVQRMGLARGEEVRAVALEVLQEVIIEALSHAERFDPMRQPMAWVLGIGVNVIRRKKVELARRTRREMSIGDFSTDEPLSEGELFDRVMSHSLHTGQAGPEQDTEANEQAQMMLALVSEDDQRILCMAFLHDFEREALAKELGISAVAARVRLHRALSRLRVAWRKEHLLQTRGEGCE